MHYFWKITVFILIIAGHNLSAASILTSPDQQSYQLGRLQINTLRWDIKSSIFNGQVTATNISSSPSQLVISGEFRGSRFYDKKVTIPAGQSASIPVFIPIDTGNTYYNRTINISTDGKKELWGRVSGYSYYGSSDYPLLKPSRSIFLSDDYRSYTNIYTLRLDKQMWTKLPKSQKHAILDWVELGGNLQLSGYKTNSSVLGDFKPMKFMEGGGTSSRGRVEVKKEFTEENGNDNALTSMSGRSSNFRPSPSWEVKFISPYTFIPAVLLFAILIGPLSIFISRKKRRPGLVLIIIPSVSLASCVLILLLSLFNDGITPKVCRQVISYLDQTQCKIITDQIIGIEAPIGLQRSVQFPEKAIVYLPYEYEGAKGSSIINNGKVELSGFVAARTPTFFGSTKLEHRREKLEVSLENGNVIVMNGLGTTAKSLILRDSDGTYWTSNSPIAPGGKATLKKTRYPGKQYANMGQARITSSIKVEGRLDRGCYQAELEENIFGDDGISSQRNVGDHFTTLIGRYR